MKFKSFIFLSSCVLILGLLMFLIGPRDRASLRPISKFALEVVTPSTVVSTPVIHQIAIEIPAHVTKPAKNATFYDVSRERAFCEIQRANLGIPLEGKLKMFVLSYQLDEVGSPGYSAFVYSDKCPAGRFSFVKISHLGGVNRVLDCRTTSLEELAMHAAIQGNIQEVPFQSGKLQMGVSGDGYFVEKCPGGVFLTRSGDFQIRERVVVRENCSILGTDGNSFIWDGQDLNEEGCDEGGQCMAIAHLEAANIAFISNLTFKTISDPLRSLVERPRLFSQSLEIWDHESGRPIGPTWESVPLLNDPIDCDKILENH